MEPSGDDKLEAATTAAFLVIMGALILMLVGGAIITLWSTGFTNFVVIGGLFVGVFAIGRALYHTILEKDFL